MCFLLILTNQTLWILMDFVSSDTYDGSIKHSFFIYNLIYMFAHLSIELKAIS